MGAQNHGLLITIALVALANFGACKAATNEEILAWEIPAEIQTNYPYYLSGNDYEGSPVWIAEVGKWDVRAMPEKGGEVLKNYMQHVQQMFTHAAESGKEHDLGGTFIMDMDGFNSTQATHPKTILIWIDSFRMFEEVVKKGGMKQGIIINANSLFIHLFDLAKPLLGDLQKDVEVHGTNPERWIPKLLKIIPKDQLPEHLGGIKDFKPVKIFG